METGVPEGVPEVWNARILDTSLRTMGKVVSCDRSALCGSKRVSFPLQSTLIYIDLLSVNNKMLTWHTAPKYRPPFLKWTYDL